MKATTVLFPPVRPARLTPCFPLSAAEPTALPAPVSSTAADATTPVVAPVASTLSPFIARPVPVAAATTSPDAAKATNPADKPQYVFTWFLNNYLGTTIASSNAAEEIAEIETDAFGAPLARGTLPADMRYTGKPYDEDMGAYIFPFRTYRPDEARWMTPDPSGFPDGPNNRVYASNPNLSVDPLGLTSLTTSSYSSNNNVWGTASFDDKNAASGLTYTPDSYFLEINNVGGDSVLGERSSLQINLPNANGWFVQEVQSSKDYTNDEGEEITETHHWLEGLYCQYNSPNNFTISGPNSSGIVPYLTDQFSSFFPDWIPGGSAENVAWNWQFGHAQYFQVPYASLAYGWTNDAPEAGPSMFSINLMNISNENQYIWTHRNVSLDALHDNDLYSE